MKQRLFTYAVILHTIKKESDGKINPALTDEYESELIIQPTTILAKSEKDVVFKVTRLIPESAAENPDNVEILVRPF